ncbi:four helix bundle protein [Wenyingzhuangia fucanilytica]|uniref:Four helix bundle protein n=1 Tax=Wenyingzhuangia fucanilytica TaxID=1790137 RepID=A0A1B1Y8A5_9FLAO|nr:four helix bundle protein [Wenyingzhuangia fucanilytica]ANW97010.1 four helix bundle protein [Wenyingzhuangia fucanilytica]
MSNNIILDKTYNFAIKIVKLSQYLVSEKKEYVLSKQILRSGTSVGANTEEAIGGFSKKDFIYKLNIAYKEARETKYWLRILKDTGYIESEEFEVLFDELEQILKILFTIIKKSKENGDG